MNSSEKIIFSFLKQQNRQDLCDRFNIIVSMARRRRDVLTKIIGLSDTLFQHSILYILFKKNGITISNSWKTEIQDYLDSIDALNSGKKKRWLNASQIMEELNHLLEPTTRRLIDNKLNKFDLNTQRKLKNSLDEFFKKPKLENLFTIKYVDNRLVLIELLDSKKKE